MSEIVKGWTDDAAKLLVGQKIKRVGYLMKEEIDAMGWSKSSLFIEFESGLQIWASRDDEGNDAGALFTTDENLPTIPVIYLE